jgi:DNA topoisomerase-1
VEEEFQPEYQVIKGKEKILKELKKAAGKVTNIYLAPTLTARARPSPGT